MKKRNNILTEVKMRTGCPMHIVTVLPHQKQLGKGHSKRLSRKARHRLEIIDWYNQISERKSRTGLKDASLTCRHFGIERSYFYKRHNFFFRADTKPFKRRSKSGVRAFERRREPGESQGSGAEQGD